jgi:flagellar hook-associated protein 2
MASVDGLISGLNTTTIIAELMAIERLPKAQLVNGQTTSQTMVTTLQSLNSLITGMQTAATAFVPDTITKASAWTSTIATSSQGSLASVLAGAQAQPGSASFTVISVAASGAAVSAGIVGSLTDPVVGAGGPFLLSKGAPHLGLSGIDGGPSLSAGVHHVEVTQSSAGASVSGTAVAGFGAMPPAVKIDGSNNSISFYRDGSTVPTIITLNPGTYSPVQLAAEIGRASGGAITSSVDSSNRLQLTSVVGREGSAATIQLAVSNDTLGLTAGTIGHGIDGVIALDGIATTVTSVDAGQQLTLNGVGTDSILATAAGGLRKGVATASAVTVAAGASLTDVVNALNGPGTGVSANAVQVAEGAYRLQVTSTTTGSASDITVSGGAFVAGLGGMQQLSAGRDTVLRVGTGPGAFDVTSSTASVSGLMPGVTIAALASDPSTPVLINVASDSSGMADKMATMVSQANAVLSYIAIQSSYDATAKIGGPMVGDLMGRDLTLQITDAVIGTSSSTPAVSGVSVARDGSITFDRAAFLAAYAADPATVTSTMTAMSSELVDVAKQASSPTGYVTARVMGEQDSIRGYTEQIAAFEDRMTLRQQTIKAQYDSLEVMLGTLKSQSEWLAGQLGSLPTYSYNTNAK